MRRKGEAGQSILLVAAALVLLMGFMGLAIDMGVLRYEKRLQQTAADAAALAGASDLDQGNVTSAAQDAAAANGFADTGGGNVAACGSGAAIGTVCVQAGAPISGPHTGNGAYVEVLVAAVHATYFVRILGINQESITARAVATNASGGPSSNGCLYTLGPPPASIEDLGGGAVLDAPTCGIEDDGNYVGGLTVNAETFGVSGRVSGGGRVSCTTSGPCPSSGMPAVGDPLSTLPPPTQPGPSASCPRRATCNVTTTGRTTLQPGTYSSLTIGRNSTVTLDPGIYFIYGAGGLQLDGGGSVTGNDVMFYFTGSATINALGPGNTLDSIDLTPPASGVYAGVSFYQDPNDTANPTLGGNQGSQFGGIAYFPSAEPTFYGHATAGVVIAKALALNGATLDLEGAALLPAGVNLLGAPTLVE